jgi:hypothetical protein
MEPQDDVLIERGHLNLWLPQKIWCIHFFWLT